MKPWIFPAVVTGVLWIAALDGASAQVGDVEGFALVVGSNSGGPGQDALRYAEQDATRVGAVLTTLGGYPEDRVERLLRPTAAELRAAIDRIRTRALPLIESGKQWRFFFYYSGHARADALNLGSQELPLSELRERILSLPATLSIVVLDACQSGAFSRVKGAGGAADFSFNSVTRLNTEGVAVIASSSAHELSQESEALRSSFFTHHWLVALRGAGDRDADGRVTLSEAYQYAYNHTLATTAQTKVGEQHATLETSFKGQDDVPLTQPSAASAHLRVPSGFEGRVLVQHLPSWSVLAELDKVRGEPVVLALPPGAYAASLRVGSDASRCNLTLRDGAETLLDPSRCSAMALTESDIKGAPTAGREPGAADGGDEGFIVELAVGAGEGRRRDAYVRRLEAFELQETGRDSLRFAFGVGRRVHPNLVVGLSYFNLESAQYARDIELEQSFSWNAHALGPFVQGDLGLGSRRMLNVFARAGAGISIAWTNFDAALPQNDFLSDNPAFENTTVGTRQVTQHFVRPCGWLSAGLQIMPWRELGLQLELRYALAPGLENELAETHDLGGFAFTAGLRVRTWE